MNSWGRALGFGVLVWLLPFVVAFLAFALRSSARPVFESIMSVSVTAAAVIFGLLYLSRSMNHAIREGLLVGLLWFVVCIAIDAPLMLLGGPMQMSLGEYMGDIGLTYLGIPVVTTGLGVARSWSAGK